MANTIHLIRHGAVQPAGEQRYIGSTDLPLNDAGIKQATALGTVLADLAIDAVFISPMLRAQQTAKLVFPESTNSGSMPKQPPETVAALREVDFGDWEGLTFPEIMARSPELVPVWATGNPSFAFPNGDCVAEFRTRICTVSDELAARDDLNTIAIVAHAGVIQTLVCHFLNLPLESHWSFTIGHASLTTVEVAGSFGSLKRLNFTPSLTPNEDN